MEGMLLALQPRTTQMEKTVALNSRLAVLLERKSKEGSMKGLERRLARLQKSPAKPVESQETGAEKKIGPRNGRVSWDGRAKKRRIRSSRESGHC